MSIQEVLSILGLILTPLFAGYGALWLYFQRQSAKIVELMEARLKEKDEAYALRLKEKDDRIADHKATIDRILGERNAFQGLAWDAVRGVKQSTENTHKALSLTEALREAQR